MLNTKSLTKIALLLAVLIVLSQISIPLPFSPVPFTLGILGIFLCASILNKYHSLILALCYLALGFVGLPVFAGFNSGFGALFLPSGGFLISYPIVCFLTSLLIEKFPKNIIFLAISMAIGLIVCYLIGTIYFSLMFKKTFLLSLTLVCLPFVPFDILKIALCVPVAFKFHKTQI